MKCKFWYILMFVLAVVWALLFIERHRQRIANHFGTTTYGGAFDIHKFIAGLRKKYTSPQDHIEIELKLKEKGVYDCLAKYVRTQPEYTEENTVNRIWYGENGTNIIETTIAKNKRTSSVGEKWSTKKRLSKYDTDLGAVTISLEHELDEKPATVNGEPTLVRHKNRISVAINKHWRVDCTQVEQNIAKSGIHNQTIQNEVEIEYIAEDYWNALERIDEISEFLQRENITSA